MFASALFILITSIIFFTVNRREKSSYLMSLYFMLISVLLIAAGIYLSKMGYYVGTDILDSHLLLRITAIKISIPKLTFLYNSIVCLVFFIQVLFVLRWQNLKKLKLVLLIISFACYLYFNSSDFAWNVFIYANTPNATFIERHLGYIVKAYNSAFVIFYILYPVLSLVLVAVKTGISRIRKQCISFAVILLTANVIIYFSVISLFSYNIGYDIETGYVNQSTSGLGQVMSLYLLPVAIAISAVLYTVFTTGYNSIGYMMQESLSKSVSSVSKNVNLSLHIYKNAFISCERIADFALENIEDMDIEALKNNISLIKELSHEKIETINCMLGRLKGINIISEKQDLKECLNDTLRKANIPSFIEVETDYDNAPVYVKYDYVHMQDAFLNIINNSITAITKSKKEKCKITLKVFTDTNYAVVSFYDNGCGIEHDKIKHIFDLFSTSGNRGENSGVGLHYVKNVIERHGGFVEVLSEPCEYTNFKVVLPIRL